MVDTMEWAWYGARWRFLILAVNRRDQLAPKFLARRGGSERRGELQENAIPRSVKKTVIACALAGLKALSQFLRVISRLVLLVLIAPIVFLIRQLIRPILLAIYRWSFPLRLALQRIVAPAKNALLYPLTTRSVAHIFIGLVTLVVTTNSIAAKEIKTTSDGQGSLLSHFIVSEDEDPLTIVYPQKEATAIPQNDSVLAKSDAATPAEEADTSVNETTALEKPMLSETTASGTPRREIVVYAVQGGDTVSTIAERFGISAASLLWANGLSEGSFIKPGQNLNVPPVSGVLHTVKRGDTIGAIANKYKASADSILEFNQLADAGAIEEGQVLVVPGGSINEPGAAPSPAPQPGVSNEGPNVAPPSVQPSGPGLLWPTGSRRINRGFLGYHPALDIDGDIGSPIYAAADGVVESVIYQRYGYGYHVIINHGNGRKTLYAHAAKIFVKPGQHVTKGQTISTVGMTGRTTGPHLHFELIINGGKVNPLGYLNR